MGLGLFLAGGRQRAGSRKYLEESIKENPNSSEVRKCTWSNVISYVWLNRCPIGDHRFHIFVLFCSVPFCIIFCYAADNRINPRTNLLSFFLSSTDTLSLSLSPSFSLSITIALSFLQALSFLLSIYLTLYLSIYQSIYLSICLSLPLSKYMHVFFCPSFPLSLYWCVYMCVSHSLRFPLPSHLFGYSLFSTSSPLLSYSSFSLLFWIDPYIP